MKVNKQIIAKNTLALYFRMLLNMVISLITVRVVLRVLGVVDYGIYNVVGGIVPMLSFISGTMATASQRFFSIDLGQSNEERLKQNFSLNVTIFFGIAIIILILCETIGLWILETRLEIPAERMTAARWLYQFSIFSFLLSIVAIPYYAIITAREKMSIYAYISILESLFKLGIVYLLVLFSYDKLITYSILLFVGSFFVNATYIIYCKFHFQETRYHFFWNRAMFKEIVSFAGWNLFGALSGVLRSQGVNILLNIFFGPIVNAARSVAYQVYNAVNQFVRNFFIAVNPQITKSYAIGETKEMIGLVNQSSKFSYFLIYFFALPLMIELPLILELWLKEIPEYVISFTRLIIIVAVLDSLSNPLIAAVQATGKIRMYQIVTGSIILLNLPLSYLFLKMGYPPQSTFYISIVITVVSQISRIYFVNKLIHISIKQYLKEVIWVCVYVSIIAALVPITITFVMEESIVRFLIVGTVSVLCTISTIYYLGITSSERIYLHENIKQIIKNHSNETKNKGSNS